MDTVKVQLAEPVSFIGITYRSMGEGLLTRAEMTQRQLHHQGPSSWVTAHKNWETWSKLYSFQAVQQVGMCSFQETLV